MSAAAPRVRVSRHAKSERAGETAIVIRKERRERSGSYYTPRRHDYWLRFADGWEGWFWDTEVEEQP